jgi:hypothetical protein
METDIKIEVPNSTSGEIEEISIKAFFEDTEKEWVERSSAFLCRAEFNEKMIAGDQFLDIINEQIVDDAFWSESSKSSRNFLANLCLTWASRVLEERPSIHCYPNEPGIDVKKAEAANKLLEYAKQNQDFDDLCFEAAMLVQPHSAVAFKTVWDPLSGPLGKGVQAFSPEGLPLFNPDGSPVIVGKNKPLGDISWSVISIFDYYTDGSEDIEDSEYVCFKDIISVNAARKFLDMYQKENQNLSAEEYTNQWGVKANGVMLKEMWIRPGHYQFPDGLFSVMVGDVVLFATAFPYDHGELPLAVWKVGKRRNSEYGTSHVDNAVYIQKVINHNVAAIDTQAKMAKDVKLLGHTSIIDKMQDGVQHIPCDDPQLAQATRWLEPPDRAKVLVSSLADNERALFAVFGLNELLSGADSMKSGTAAKSIAYLNKLDSMKMAGASRSLNKAILRVMRQTLKLYQQFVQAPRIAQILGKGNLYEPLEFIGADIAGVDVKLEPISGFSQYRANIAEEAQMGMQQTGPTPEGMSQMQTGLRQTSYDKSQRDIVSAQIDAVIKGMPQEADNTLDPMIAVDEILGVITQYYGTPIGQNLMTLLQSYRTAAQQQQQQMMQAQNGVPQ